jgi:hypothetical protein
LTYGREVNYEYSRQRRGKGQRGFAPPLHFHHFHFFHFFHFSHFFLFFHFSPTSFTMSASVVRSYLALRGRGGICQIRMAYCSAPLSHATALIPSTHMPIRSRHSTPDSVPLSRDTTSFSFSLSPVNITTIKASRAIRCPPVEEQHRFVLVLRRRFTAPPPPPEPSPDCLRHRKKTLI